MFNLPDNPKGAVRFFGVPTTVTNVQWHTWIKPAKNFVMAHIICVSGAGGGGGGFSASSGAARGGGGGGGGGGITRVSIPLALLPDRLYIQVGAGGAGGTAGAAGSNGVLSYVSLYPNTAATNNIAISGAAAPVGGSAGTGSAGGSGGTAGTIAVIGSCPVAGLGQYSFVAGQAGANGGAQTGANGGNYTIPTTGIICTGGAGGAGTTSADFAGGACTFISDSYLSDQRPLPPAGGSNNGGGGYNIRKPFWNYGGCGGSASNTGVGGHGGNGGPGCGGGGGGGGTTGGSGGRGGDGFVLITCW